MISTSSGKLGSNRAVTFFKGTWHHVRIRERKGPSQGVTQKCEPQERSPLAPKYEDRTQDETLQQKTMCPQRSAGLGEKCLSAQKTRNQGHVLQPYRSMVNASTLFETARGTRVFGIFRSINAHTELKRIYAQQNWNHFESPATPQR